MTTVTEFLESRDLMVSPEKSTATLFTPDTHEFKVDPTVFIKGVAVPVERRPKLLGVTFDTMYCFGPHIEKTVNKVKSKLNILKSLTGTDWGQNKEIMLTTYKAICRSNLEYGSHIWSPIITPTNWDKLQRLQNCALRIATGCLQMSSIDHLHQESKVLQVKEHCTMIRKQYLAACQLPAHPGNKHVGVNKGRNNKPTFYQHQTEITGLLGNEISTSTYKKTIKEIHTREVSKAINALEPNKVLGTRPPAICKTEKTLPRPVRTELARLRSGYSRQLNSYLHRLDPVQHNEECPKCNTHQHTTSHLFNCPADPTPLQPIHLWEDPRSAARFLGLLETAVFQPP